MRFWQLSAPEYASDYQQANINGSIDWDLQFPTVDCDVCLTSWEGSRPQAYLCPESLRCEMSTRDHKRSLFHSEHVKLQKKFLDELNLQGEPFLTLRPGGRFPPLQLDIPSRPRADFLWPFGAVVVSARIRDLLVDLCHQDVAIFPVNLRKVGRREAKLPTPIPRSGEPEDIINEAPLLADTSGIEPYFEVVPRQQSREHRVIESQCGACGWIKTKVIQTKKWERRMVEDHWNGERIFYWGGTLFIAVTEDVKNALQAVHPSNVELIEM